MLLSVLFQPNGLAYEDFWALRRCLIFVAAGRIPGYLRRERFRENNLLKVLANILPMTHGHIAVHGKIATLLDLGTDFFRS